MFDKVLSSFNGLSCFFAMDTDSRAQTATDGGKSGGKIVKRRRYAAARTPYDRPPPPQEDSGSNWLTGLVIPGAARMIKGATKLLSFMADTSTASSSSAATEDEDDVVSCDGDDDDDIPSEKDVPLTGMIKRKEPQLLLEKSPKAVIENLVFKETFSREESDKLVEIIKSRVVDHSTMDEGHGTGLMETPSRKFDSPDQCSKAIMEEKHWFEEKRVGSSSKSDMDHGLSAFGSVPLQHLSQFEKSSPVDMARSYMQARPPWASPSLKNSGAKTPSPMAIDPFKDEKLFSVNSSSIPSAKKRETLSAGSWNIQDEIRKVCSKATEDMLRTLPSTRIDISSFTLEPKIFKSSVVRDGGSSGDKVQMSNPLPEKELVDESVNLAAASSTFHDVAAKETHLKDGSNKMEDDLGNSGAQNANGAATLRSSLSAGMEIEQNTKQSDEDKMHPDGSIGNKPTTTISEEEVRGLSTGTSAEIPIPHGNDSHNTADGLHDSADQIDGKNGTPGKTDLKEKQPEKMGRYQRKGRGRTK